MRGSTSKCPAGSNTVCYGLDILYALEVICISIAISFTSTSRLGMVTSRTDPTPSVSLSLFEYMRYSNEHTVTEEVPVVSTPATHCRSKSDESTGSQGVTCSSRRADPCTSSDTSPSSRLNKISLRLVSVTSWLPDLLFSEARYRSIARTSRCRNNTGHTDRKLTLSFNAATDSCFARFVGGTDHETN